MTKPLVSIITTTRNRPDFLRKCIIAIQNQTMKDYEHIIIADRCSYAERVYDQFKEDTRIRFYSDFTDPVSDDVTGEQKYDQSPATFSKKVATDVANSEFICYCDDDNLFLPNHVEMLYRKIIDGYDVVYSNAYYVTIGKYNGSCLDLLSKNIYYVGELQESKRFDYPDQLRMMHTKEILEKVGGWKPPPGGGRNSDMCLIEKFRDETEKIVTINDYTSIYYIKNGYDQSYMDALRGMHKSQLYLSPELPKFENDGMLF